MLKKHCGFVSVCIVASAQNKNGGIIIYYKKIKNVKRCRDGMPKSMQTR